MPASWQRVLAVVGIAWALLAAASALRATLALPTDPMPELEAEFRALIPELPPTGEVGYLERYYDDGAADVLRVHYAAQYALAPRIIVSRLGPEYMIVARGTERPGGDPRLTGYFLAAQTAAGHRVFRRLIP